MYDNLARSNKEEVETALRNTFKNARSIQYQTSGSSLKGTTKYRNQWYNYEGAIATGECVIACFVYTLMYGFFGSMIFCLCENVVWTWILFGLLFIITMLAAGGSAEVVRDSQTIVIVGLDIFFALLVVFIFWQIQKANPGKLPQTINLDILFKFHFK
jgi:hypothetical protein